MTTMQDVAELANVSAKTVSRVYNDDPHVSPDTRARVMAALESLNYVPNTMATTFRTGRPAAIGLAVPDIADPFFAAIAHAVETSAHKRDMAVIMTSLGDDRAQERPIVESLLRRRLSGLILAPTGSDHGYLKRWTTQVPTVFVDRATKGVPSDSFVHADHDGAVMATEHQLKLGHRRVAFVGDTESIPTTRNRLLGYRHALDARNIPQDEELIVMGAGTREGAGKILEMLMSLASPPTALFLSNARISMASIPAIQQLNLHDLSTIGFGDFPMADALSPPFTVIDQSPADLGRQAMDRVLHRIDHPRRRYRRNNVLPVRLIERGSCFPPVHRE
ncbi:LacI family transcriptional regulator [Rhodococcus sp. WMMA185]|uniref:LacI family DNA-binding transcriptional regulator n=1 Tax=Rhodococcus sp. WMMA185 TaxID=679318 RepID=UPI000878BC7E|nr:LacI family DNA-binding transcriptional regulator [Rhodococcus sp. WMMA185]AOW94347.1 LacI family transcriptional regulator [Rhodococcus sp. WMMA185]